MLRTYKLGEADRIVVLMTEARGKVRAVAKGVRKTKSRFGARLEPTSHVALLLYEGRRARHRQPGRVDRPLPRDPRGPRPPRAGRRHARGGRPGRAGARARLRASTRCSSAALRTLAAKHVGRSSCRRSSGRCSPSRAAPRARSLRDVRERHRSRRLRRRSGRRALPHLSSRGADQPGRTCPHPSILGGGLAAALDEPSSPTTTKSRCLATRSARTPPRTPHPLDDRPRPRLTPGQPWS